MSEEQQSTDNISGQEAPCSESPDITPASAVVSAEGINMADQTSEDNVETSNRSTSDADTTAPETTESKIAVQESSGEPTALEKQSEATEAGDKDPEVRPSESTSEDAASKSSEDVKDGDADAGVEVKEDSKEAETVPVDEVGGEETAEATRGGEEQGSNAKDSKTGDDKENGDDKQIDVSVVEHESEASVESNIESETNETSSETVIANDAVSTEQGDAAIQKSDNEAANADAEKSEDSTDTQAPSDATEAVAETDALVQQPDTSAAANEVDATKVEGGETSGIAEGAEERKEATDEAPSDAATQDSASLVQQPDASAAANEEDATKVQDGETSGIAEGAEEKKEATDEAPSDAAIQEIVPAGKEEAILSTDAQTEGQSGSEGPPPQEDAQVTESKKPKPPMVLPKPKIEIPEKKIELFVKAHSRFPNKIGDCPFSHRIMMVLKLKRIGGSVCPVNLNIKPPEFEDFCAKNGLPMKVPILKHGEETVIGDSNLIADYLDKLEPKPDLVCKDKKIIAAGDKIFLKFSAYVKNRIKSNDEKLRHGLVDELERLDSFLGSTEGVFLDGNDMKHPDCALLPKLQHVRVASKHYKKFDMPENLVNLNAYLAAADNHPAFSSTVPSDDAIIEGWRKHVS